MFNSQPAKQRRYLCVRERTAAKLGARSGGALTYGVFTDVERTHVFVAVLSNAGGGNYSKEMVETRYIEEAIADIVAITPFSSKALASAFVGRSATNAGFLAAMLVAEGLLAPAPDVKYKLVRCGDLERWKADALACEGTPYMYPPLKGGEVPAACASEAAALTTDRATGAVDGGEPANGKQRKNRRGGNRLVKVGAKGTEDSSPEPDVQEPSDADPA